MSTPIRTSTTEGGYAYLVGDQWHYAGRWALLRSVPPGLYRYRLGFGRGVHCIGYPRSWQLRGYYRQQGVNVTPPAAPLGRDYGRPAERVR